MKTITSLLTLAALTTAVFARTFTVKNNCPFTIWPALYTDLNAGTAVPDQATGWVQDTAQAVSFSVPDNWRAGRIWGRRNCDFSTGTPGPTQCLDGGCNGGLECDPHTGTGVPPVTVAEFTLGTNGAFDNYDVSLVDGFNLPMRIETSDPGCAIADCPVDLVPNCPSQLKGPFDTGGAAVGCNSACTAGLGDPTNNPNCCTGTHSTPATCPPSAVQFYPYFKGNCPNSLAYAFDEQTVLWPCESDKAADYTVTFCP
ncbi:Osmotin thaumatin-like protein [Trametes gibbosa]|nr:Osmotin thaumatin-like protein [Trametes gibbosa]